MRSPHATMKGIRMPPSRSDDLPHPLPLRKGCALWNHSVEEQEFDAGPLSLVTTMIVSSQMPSRFKSATSPPTCRSK